MSLLLKQSTARNCVVFMTDATDNISGKTGQTLTITASKDGAAFASITPTVTELTNGFYSLALTTTHTNTLGDLDLYITSSGATPLWVSLDVVADLPGATVTNVTGTISAAAIQSIWDALTSALTTSGSIGKRIVDNLNATISSVTALLPAALVGGRIDASVGAYQTGLVPLQPTTAGRTLDVSATGEAGLDFDNIKDASGAHTLTNITIPVVSAITGLTASDVGAIKAKTDNLPSDPADASDIAASFTTVNSKLDAIDDYVDTEVAAIKAKTDNLPSDPADASDIAALFATVNSKLDAIDDYVDTEVAAIKAKTDNLPSDPADASDIAAAFSTVNSTLSTIAGYVDTEVAAIKAKTDNLPAVPASQGDVTTVGTAVTAIKAQTDNFSFDSNRVISRVAQNDDKTGYSLIANQVNPTKNQPLTGFLFPMFSATTKLPLTGLTVLAQISVDAGVFSASSNDPYEVGNGFYAIDLDSAELNGNTIAISFTAVGADPLPVSFITQEV